MPGTTTDRIDGVQATLAIKAPVRVATTAAIVLAGLQTIDGVALTAEDRVLVKDQTDATLNGIYVAGTSSWQRAKDFDGNRDAAKGTQVYVTDGTSTGIYRCADAVTIGETEITFSPEQIQFGSVEDADNYLLVQGSDTTAYGPSSHGAVLLQAKGAATSVRMDFMTKHDSVNNYGSSGFAFYDGPNRLLMRLEPTGVNYAGSLDRHLHVEPGYSGTGQYPSIRSMANDGYIGPGGTGTVNNVTSANINIGILACGRGFVGLFTRGGNTDTAVGGGAGTGGGQDVLQAMVADTPAANAFVELRGGTGSSDVRIGASGANTNQGLTIFSQRGGSISFATNAVTYSNSGGADTTQVRIAHTASAVNYWSLTGAATGNSPNLQAAGTDANIGLIFASKGSGSIGLYTNTTKPQVLIVDGGASTVNSLYLKGSATGVALEIGAYPSGDTNIDITLVPRGTGMVNSPGMNATGSTIPANGIYLPSSNTLGLASRSLKAVEVTNPASAVNYLTMTGAATAGLPTFGAWGTDTNVSLALNTKGTGSMYLYTNFSTLQVQVAHTASAVNYLQLTGAATGGGVAISALGSDANIDLILAPKGTGMVRFGAFTSNADAAVNGYVTHKLANGSTVKLATIA